MFILVAVIGFATLPLLHGVPCLRHDWDWPLQRQSAWWWCADRVWGWRLGNYGSPNAYPTLYLIAPVRSLLVAVLGPLGSLWAYLVLIASAVICSTRRACFVFFAQPPSPALLALALFHPWIYTELVAGHLEMILAGAGLLYAGAAARTGNKSDWLWAVMLCLAQLQFFMLLLPLALWLTKRLRQPLFLGSWLLVASPVLTGMFSEKNSLLQVPMLVRWQQIESVPFPAAIVGGGYFLHYADHMMPVFIVGLLFLLGSRAQLAMQRPSPAVIKLIIAMLLITAGVAGYLGPFGPVYGYLVEHVRILGLYRELYDMAGIIILVQILMFASIPARRIPRCLDSVAFLLMLGSWLVYAPAQWFIPTAPPNSQSQITKLSTQRYAFLPAFQPLSWQRQGQGIDPDSLPLALSPIPLNSYTAEYPADAGLALAEQQGNTALLERLGVDTVYERAYFRSFADTTYDVTRNRILRLKSYPTLSVIDKPAIAVLDQFPHSAILARDAGWPIHSLAPLVTTDIAQNSWIDARLVYSAHPEIAQAYGGVYTESQQPYTGAHEPWLLLWVNGVLSSGHDRVEKHGGAITWWHRHDIQSPIRCQGACSIIAQAEQRMEPLESPPPRSVLALTLHRLAPFLAWTQLPGPMHGWIEFNERFDAGWVALTPQGLLDHIRLDGISNGYHLPLLQPPWILFLHLPSIAEAILEVLAWAWLIRHFWRQRNLPGAIPAQVAP